MNRNPISSAVQAIDEELSPEFLASLRAALLVDLTGQRSDDFGPSHSDQSASQSGKIVTLAAQPTDGGSRRRVLKIALGAAACVALFAAIGLIINRPGNKLAADELHDVDQHEALVLGQSTPLAEDAVGSRWRQVDDFTTADYAQVSSATYAALPECAKFTNFGLLPPTTKSAMVHQDYTNGSSLLFHDVIVFATPEDASKAMDAMAGSNFGKCWFDVFDRLTPLGRYVGATSESVDLPAPNIEQHGDRQIIIGQHVLYAFQNGPQARDFVNAYVQVGRAIAFVNPELIATGNGLSNVEKIIAASTQALEAKFGH
ncbi:MAG TPA: hypothetical protein VFE86_11510 [Ilumatobacteraceae bacterium]|nr:hypothetical protein [Ilumatobacteraceae bacterium]